jgi:hypothetical protein
MHDYSHLYPFILKGVYMSKSVIEIFNKSYEDKKRRHDLVGDICTCDESILALGGRILVHKKLVLTSPVDPIKEKPDVDMYGKKVKELDNNWRRIRINSYEFASEFKYLIDQKA